MLKEQISRAFKYCILQACKGDYIICINVNRRILLGKAPFYKYISNSKYFKHINVGIEVLRGKRYCKEVILWQCRGMRALLTIKSRIGLSRGIRAPLTIKSRMGLSKSIRAPLTIRSRMGLNRGIRAPLTIKSRMGLNKGIRALLTIRSKMGLSRGIAWAAIEEVNITVFG